MASRCLASENRGSWNSVAVEVVVDVDSVAGVGGLESTRNADAAGNHRSTAGDLDLGTADIELWDTGRIGVVDTQLLDAEQVVAWCKAGWDSSAIAH
jgi:hypothetical protein